MASNPYGTGHIAGPGRRDQLNRGILGMTAITARSARQAAEIPAVVDTHGNIDEAAKAELAASAGSPADLRRCRHDG